LANLAFSLPAGEVLGVIGPSGCGKSTLARLLVGAWTPLAGKVRLDGSDLAQWDKQQLGPHIGYLPQDIQLFAGSIAENIARLDKVDADKVLAAAQMAGVHQLILQLPQGYETQNAIRRRPSWTCPAARSNALHWPVRYTACLR